MPQTPPLAVALAACLCATPVFAQAPPNDTRATATALTADRGFCNPTVGNTANATAAGPRPSCAPASQTQAYGDIWYAFEASRAEMTVYAEIDDGDNNQLTLEVTDADGAVVDCDGFSYAEAVRRLTGLTVGDTYAIQLSHTAPGEANVLKVCAYETPSCLPVEDVRMRNGQNWTVVTWSPEGPPPARGYRVVVGPRRRFDPVNDTPIAEVTVAPSGRGLERAIVWGLEPGEAYDFYVQALCSDTDASAFRGPTQLFSQEPAGPVGNDSLTAGRGPAGLASVSRACSAQPGSTRFATSGDGVVGACAAAGPDVWYQLTTIASRYTFEVRSANGTTADLALEAYTYDFDSGNDFVTERIACVNAAGPGGAESLTISEAQLPAVNDRRRVRVRVIATDGTPSDFTICAYQDVPPVFDPDGCAPVVIADFDGTGAPGDLRDVRTDEGQLICSIENTEDLGQLSVNAYRHTGDAIRTAGDVPYADRNVAIRVERQPTAPVAVRFYLSAADLASLIAAGAFPADGREIISRVVDGRVTGGELLSMARVTDRFCSADFPGSAAAVTYLGAGPYGTGGYYVDVRVPGFSEFFFSGIDDPLPTTPTSVTEAAPEAHLTVAPNPARAHVQVTLPQNPTRTPQAYRVHVLNATGRTVRTVLAKAAQPQAELDVAHLPAGVDVLRAVGTLDGSAASARVIVR